MILKGYKNIVMFFVSVRPNSTVLSLYFRPQRSWSLVTVQFAFNSYVISVQCSCFLLFHVYLILTSWPISILYPSLTVNFLFLLKKIKVYLFLHMQNAQGLALHTLFLLEAQISKILRIFLRIIPKLSHRTRTNYFSIHIFHFHDYSTSPFL